MSVTPSPILVQAARFGLVGVANTLIGGGIILALTWWGINPFLANVCGYVVGTLFSFAVNSRWTFASPDAGGAKLVRFILVILAAWGVNALVLAAFIHLGWGNMASQVPAMICFTVANFLGQRYFTFRPEGRSP